MVQLFLSMYKNEVVDLTDYQASDKAVRVKLTYNKPIDNLEYQISPDYVTVTIKEKVSDNKTVTYDLLNQDKLDEKLFKNSQDFYLKLFTKKLKRFETKFGKLITKIKKDFYNLCKSLFVILIIKNH